MMLHEMPAEVLQEIAFHRAACSLFAYILLVRATTTCKALHAAVAAARDRVVAHFNARLLLPPAYLYGEYGAFGTRWSVGVKDSNDIARPVNRDQKLTFEVHAVDGVGIWSLSIMVVLKVSIVFAPVMGCGATLELSLALNFFDVGFSLCAALGWPNGTLQAEHVESEAEQGRILQASRIDVFDRRRQNQPWTLSIDWRNALSKLTVRVPDGYPVRPEAPQFVEYTGNMQENIHFSVQAMRAVHDFNDPSGFRGRVFDPKPHLWLQLTGLNHIQMYHSFTMRELHGTTSITKCLLKTGGYVRIKKNLHMHLRLSMNGGNCGLGFQRLTFETVGELNGKASGLHLMHTFGYLEHLEKHRAEAAAAATLTP